MQRIFWELLFLTPIGYIFGYIRLMQGNNVPGITIHLARDLYAVPTKVSAKERAVFLDRFNWILHGSFLIFQSFLVVSFFVENGSNISKGIIEGAMIGYAWFASVFGIVAIVLGFFPKFDWNQKLFSTGLTSLVLLIYSTLFLPILIGILYAVLSGNTQF